MNKVDWIKVALGAAFGAAYVYGIILMLCFIID
jgi:hypothetical protein